MAIKPIQLAKYNFFAKSGVNLSSPIHYFAAKTKDCSFIRHSQLNSKTENEIAQLKILLQDHKYKYNSLKQMLNHSFGDDWVFCYSDLNDKQSDMYIECIEQKGLMAKCEQKIASLMQKIS